jgi:hypothetical protein
MYKIFRFFKEEYPTKNGKYDYIYKVGHPEYETPESHIPNELDPYTPSVSI